MSIILQQKYFKAKALNNNLLTEYGILIELTIFYCFEYYWY